MGARVLHLIKQIPPKAKSDHFESMKHVLLQNLLQQNQQNMAMQIHRSFDLQLNRWVKISCPNGVHGISACRYEHCTAHVQMESQTALELYEHSKGFTADGGTRQRQR
jgi:hypothetical protein